jgi:Baseplate J-like protein
VQTVAFQTLAGTFYVYVYAITPLASVSLLQTVQDALAGFVAFPIVGTALNPDLVGFSLSTTITLSPSATSTDAQTAVSNAVSAVQNYINNLNVGQELVIDDIGQAILTASPLIVDVGQFGP